MLYLDTQHRRNVRAVVTVGVLRKDFKSISSPHRWTVCVGFLPLGHTETAQCSIGPVALSSCTVQIQVKFSVQLLQYHGLTASLWPVECCPLYCVGQNFWLATAEFSNLKCNIIAIIFDFILPSDIQTNFCNFHFSEKSHMHHKSHSPKAHYNFLHSPDNLSILSTNISLSTIFSNSSLQSNK